MNLHYMSALSPSIDLEGLANHMGSSFGGVKGAQPSQKLENMLCDIFYTR